MKTRPVVLALVLGLTSVPLPLLARPAAQPVAAAPVRAGEGTAKEKAVELCRAATEKRRAGDYEGAVAACRAALFLEAKNAEVYAELAEVYAAKGDNAEAAKNWRMAIGAEPGQTWGTARMDEGDLHLRFALFLFKTGQYRDADAMYREAVDRLPDDEKKLIPGKFSGKALGNDAGERLKFETTVRCALGLRLVALGALDAAGESLAEARKIAPGSALAAFAQGSLLLAKGLKVEAAACLRKAADGQDDAVRGLAKKTLAANL